MLGVPFEVSAFHGDLARHLRRQLHSESKGRTDALLSRLTHGKRGMRTRFFQESRIHDSTEHLDYCITEDDSKQDQILLIKIDEYICLCVRRRLYLLGSTVIVQRRR